MKTVSAQVCTESDFTERQDLTQKKSGSPERWKLFLYIAVQNPISRKGKILPKKIAVPRPRPSAAENPSPTRALQTLPALTFIVLGALALASLTRVVRPG
jgi:hypothetical protein